MPFLLLKTKNTILKAENIHTNCNQLLTKRTCNRPITKPTTVLYIFRPYAVKFTHAQWQKNHTYCKLILPMINQIQLLYCL